MRVELASATFPLPAITSSTASSCGGLPEGAVMVGASLAAPDTCGMFAPALSVLDVVPIGEFDGAPPSVVQPASKVTMAKATGAIRVNGGF